MKEVVFMMSILVLAVLFLLAAAFSASVAIMAPMSVVVVLVLVCLSVLILGMREELQRYKRFKGAVRTLFVRQPGLLQQAIDSILREESVSFHSACTYQAKILGDYARALEDVDGDKEHLIRTWDAVKQEGDRLVAATKHTFWYTCGSLKQMADFLVLDPAITFRESSKEYLDKEGPTTKAS